MKFFIALAVLIAVSAAAPTKPAFNIGADIQAIIAAIHSPSTDPATATLLLEQLNSLLGIDVSPVIVPEPDIIPDPVIIEEPEVVPQEDAPVNSPLVAITINVNTKSAAAPAPAPVVVRPQPEPVEYEPIVVDPVIIEPLPEAVILPEPIVVDPVIIEPLPEAVVHPEPIVVDPVIIAPIEPEGVLLPGVHEH